MNNEPIVKEQIYQAPVKTVWNALTDKNQMKEWYFDIEEFHPVIGFEFSFIAGSEEKKYIHLCKITDLVEEKKLGYSWRYEAIEGISYVTFELFPEGNKTRLRLTHTGVESFKTESPDFARESFVKGWTYIIGTSLKNYVEKNSGLFH